MYSDHKGECPLDIQQLNKPSWAHPLGRLARDKVTTAENID